MCASNSFYYVYELPAAVGRRLLGPRYQKDDQNRYDLNSKNIDQQSFLWGGLSVDSAFKECQKRHHLFWIPMQDFIRRIHVCFISINL